MERTLSLKDFTISIKIVINNETFLIAYIFFGIFYNRYDLSQRYLLRIFFDIFFYFYFCNFGLFIFFLIFFLIFDGQSVPLKVNICS